VPFAGKYFIFEWDFDKDRVMIKLPTMTRYSPRNTVELFCCKFKSVRVKQYANKYGPHAGVILGKKIQISKNIIVFKWTLPGRHSKKKSTVKYAFLFPINCS